MRRRIVAPRNGERLPCAVVNAPTSVADPCGYGGAHGCPVTPESTWSNGYRSCRRQDSCGAVPLAPFHRRDRRTEARRLPNRLALTSPLPCQAHPSQPHSFQYNMRTKRQVIVYDIFSPSRPAILPSHVQWRCLAARPGETGRTIRGDHPQPVRRSPRSSVKYNIQ